ncbi:MAG: MarR family winged helix-turn-helix transcriptional regulator [Eubacteriales bacterium]
MATKEQIETMFEKLEASHPDEFIKHFNETQAGIGAVLRLLESSKDTVTAGDISEVLHISTARVAVLLKKMVSKDLIIKESAPKDARITIVRLTDSGEKAIKEKKEELYGQIGTIIDKIGEEKLAEFIEISREIRKVIKGPKFDF